MSFRARLTTFFVLIVVIPMAAVGLLVFRLIDSSQAGKVQARVTGIAAAASADYQSASAQASLDARTIARDLALVPVARLRARTRELAARAGPARVVVSVAGGPSFSVGSASAVAPGVAVATSAQGRPDRTVELSELTAAQYARSLAGTGIAIVVRADGRTLAATLAPAAAHPLPAHQGTVAIAGRTYRVFTQSFAGFHDQRVLVSVLSNTAATGDSVSDDRLLAAVFLVGFFILAFFFALLASRALESQLAGFLDAARRLAGGDFSSQVPTTGHDEFAALGREFNIMSSQLQSRLDDLEQERARVRAAILRIGEAFASGLDRGALLELALHSAVDATGSDRGRVSVRTDPDRPLAEAGRVGALTELDQPLLDAEREALNSDGVATATVGDLHLASVRLGSMTPDGPAHGVITIARPVRPFTSDDEEILRSLATQATLAMANVNAHMDVQRQAVTDDLTGLTTHGRFQELLDGEMDQVRRYRYPTGLIMVDLDDFKAVNDTYGHLQGDEVLRVVAAVLRSNCREVDVPARYGGEELAVILPHTNLDGAYEIAERIRTTIAASTVARRDGGGVIRVTASVGAAASDQGHKNDLIAAADGALYAAKRAGKDRTVRAAPPSATALADPPNDPADQ